MGWVKWGDAPTWFAAIGTIGAVVVALRVAFGESHRRARADERRQAELITAWVSSSGGLNSGGIDKRGIFVRVANASSQAAYRLIVSSCDATRQGERPQGVSPWDWRAFISELPPGEISVFVEWEPQMSSRPAAEIAFQDSAGRRWRRDYQGALEQLKGDHVKHYGLGEPVGWKAPEREGD
jgi:hypothetical protein